MNTKYFTGTKSETTSEIVVDYTDSAAGINEVLTFDSEEEFLSMAEYGGCDYAKLFKDGGWVTTDLTS